MCNALFLPVMEAEAGGGLAVDAGHVFKGSLYLGGHCDLKINHYFG